MNRNKPFLVNNGFLPYFGIIASLSIQIPQENVVRDIEFLVPVRRFSFIFMRMYHGGFPR